MTAEPHLYPLLFEPVYKDYIWGGDRIVRRYNRTAPPAIVAESWEIADRPEGMSVVIRGALAGRTLHDLIRDYGDRLLGRKRLYDTFPLLIKIIDARQRLSVQVHPDEEAADRVGGEPKAEMWYVLDAEPGAVVYAGPKSGVTKAAFHEALDNGQIEKLLQVLPVSHGDVIHIPGGRVHAVGEGCLLLEIQQNSNTVYRLYDWGRVGRDGKPRELHVEKAMRVIRWDDAGPACPARNDEPKCKGGHVAELLRCPYFRVEHVEFSDGLSCSMDGRSFHILFVERGRVRIGTEASVVDVGPGTNVLVPANMKTYRLTGMKASHDLLRISLP